MTAVTRGALILAGCLIASAPRVAAQTAPLQDPFGAPRVPLRCEQLPADSVPPGLGYGFKFSDGRAMIDDRDIAVVYDEEGRPWSLVLVVTEPPTDRTVSIASYLVRFGRDGPGTGGLVRWTRRLDGTPVAGADSTGVRSELVDLSQSQVGQARTFAEHLWSIRCGRSGGPPQ